MLNLGKFKGKYMKQVLPPLPVPGFLQNFAFGQLSKRLLGQAHAQGIGRHDFDEVERMGADSLRALSEYLGDKPFLLGDAPSEVDCCLFAFVAAVLAGHPDDELPFKALVNDELTNLKDFFERCKDKYWPDWEECKYKEKAKEASSPKKNEEEKNGDEKKENGGEEEEKKEE